MSDKKNLCRIRTISEFNQLRNLPSPEHPLICIIDFDAIKSSPEQNKMNWMFDFYSIALKRTTHTKIKYGQQEYDFDEGVLFFIQPGQVFRIDIDENSVPEHSGWLLLIHPDFLWGSPLSSKIKQYHYFDYTINEALFLSAKEEILLNQITENIQQEYKRNIDKYSKQIIVSQIETLLNYAERFYNRQFITREKSNHQVLARLEKLLTDYFNSEDLITKGLPTVQYIADKLNISPSYLSGLLKVLTGRTTQKHIHDKLIEKAKEKLSTTELSVSEIAFELGFEHSQSFSKLFKTKTHQSPLEFRIRFN